jgi:hypothetical protein
VFVTLSYATGRKPAVPLRLFASPTSIGLQLLMSYNASRFFSDAAALLTSRYDVRKAASILARASLLDGGCAGEKSKLNVAVILFSHCTVPDYQLMVYLFSTCQTNSSNFPAFRGCLQCADRFFVFTLVLADPFFVSPTRLRHETTRASAKWS